MDTEKATVRDYMTKDVFTVKYDTLNNDVIKLMKQTKHDGYPVVDESGQIVGIITAYDLLLKDWVTVDKERHVKGIMTNTDIVRSHIERSTPTKVNAFKETMEKLYDIETTLTREQVPVEKIRPTQDRVYADELQGRTYELEKGLAEPTIVVKSGERYILVDGHHRAVASVKLGLDKIDSYVVDFHKDIKLGMEKTAEKQGLNSFNDITIIDDDQHPLIALTETIKNTQQKH